MEVVGLAFVKPGSFPRTSSGKVQRRACRTGLEDASLDVICAWSCPRPAEAHSETRLQATSDRDDDGTGKLSIRDVVHSCVAHWSGSEVDPTIDPIDHDTQLLSLGFDSVRAAALALELERSTGVRVSPDALREHPTINRLAEFLAGCAEACPRERQEPRRTGCRPPTFGGSRRSARDMPSPLSGSLAHFSDPLGPMLRQRTREFDEWRESRRKAGLWQFSRLARSPAAPTTEVAGYEGLACRCINFASQDYLGLSRDPRILGAAQDALARYGVHSAGSPVLLGTTVPMAELADTLAATLSKDDCLVFPTGWAAGYGAITGLVREPDTLILDALCHRCLVEGAYRVTREPLRFRHNDLDHLRQTLQRARERDPSNGLFVVVESLYSMDSDSPEMPAMIRLLKEFEAILILDVADDFGAMGSRGLGLLESLDGTGLSVDVVVGSFSKTFAATGGSSRPTDPSSNTAGPIPPRTCSRTLFRRSRRHLRWSVARSLSPPKGLNSVIGS